MKLLDKQDIKKFLSRYAGRDALLLDFLNQALYGPLQWEKDSLKEIESAQDIENETLARKFNNRSPPWYKFAPTPDVEESVKIVSSWLMDVIKHVGYDNINGPVKTAINGKLKSIKSMDEALTYAQGTKTLFTPGMLEDLIAHREETRQERIGFIKHVLALPGRHHVFQILTPAGMDYAGKVAENCLGDPKQPDPALPHRQRVLDAERWQYFSIRDSEDRSVATIMVDFDRGEIICEGNKRRNVPPHALKYVDLFTAYLYAEHPEFPRNPETVRYDGGLPLSAYRPA